jgi:hypothetical protein
LAATSKALLSVVPEFDEPYRRDQLRVAASGRIVRLMRAMRGAHVEAVASLGPCHG